MPQTLALPFSGRTGRYHDSDSASPLLTDDRSIRVDTRHGKYYEAALEGRVFTSSCTPLGLAIPIYTSVTPVGNVLWNPDGSGVNAALISYSACIVSGIGVQGAIGLMASHGMGAAATAATASTAPFTAFAETVPFDAYLGGIVSTITAAGKGDGRRSRVRSSSAGTCTLGTAPIATQWVRNLYVMPVNSAAVGQPVPEIYEFDGRVIVAPGTAVWVAATLASVALYAQTLEWEEVPL